MPTVVDEIAHTLRAIERANPTLNCLVEVDRDGALDAAVTAHRRRLSDEVLGPLDGTAVVIKDNLDAAGLSTRHGSAMYTDRPPATVDADAVAALRAAGAIIIGKSHMTELACGTTGHNPHFGAARNPRNLDHHPGGSSSGTAVAVAAGLVPAGLGSDTGGSIRVPAAACGVVGLKPTFGRIPTRGMSVCAAPLDHIGPIAATVTRAGDVLSVVQGPGWDDPRPQRASDLAGVRVGVLNGPWLADCDAGVAAAFESALATLTSSGAELVDLDLGLDPIAVDDHANVLGRDLFEAFGADIRAAAAPAVGAELRTWLDLYDQVDDATYDAALAERDRVRLVVAEAMQQIDLLACPTMKIGAGPAATADHESRHRRVANLTLFNMTGQPSITVPCGTATNGLPAGLLLTGRFGEDRAVLHAAGVFEATHEGWRPGVAPLPSTSVTTVSL